MARAGGRWRSPTRRGWISTGASLPVHPLHRSSPTIWQPEGDTTYGNLLRVLIASPDPKRADGRFKTSARSIHPAGARPSTSSTRLEGVPEALAGALARSWITRPPFFEPPEGSWRSSVFGLDDALGWLDLRAPALCTPLASPELFDPDRASRGRAVNRVVASLQADPSALDVAEDLRPLLESKQKEARLSAAAIFQALGDAVALPWLQARRAREKSKAVVKALDAALSSLD